MSIAGEYISARYKVLTTLPANSEKSKVELLILKDTSQLFIRKEISKETKAVAEKIKNIDNVHISSPVMVYENEDRYYIINSYVAGKTIEELLEERGVIPSYEACGYMIQLLSGLSVLHSLGIVHRDITPSNIILTPEKIIKILDFGISRESNPQKTRDTTILGTEGYAAPEQFGFRQTDFRADIYAAGVLFNQMITGKYPSECLPKDPDLTNIVLKATAMEPTDRFAGAETMKSAIIDKMEQGTSEKWNIWRNKNIPGFRTHKKWKQVLAYIIYTVMTLFMSVYIIDALIYTRDNPVREIVSAFLFFVAAPLCAGNIFNWDRAVPIISKFPHVMRIIIRIILTLALLIIGAELYVGVVKR